MPEQPTPSPVAREPGELSTDEDTDDSPIEDEDVSSDTDLEELYGSTFRINVGRLERWLSENHPEALQLPLFRRIVDPQLQQQIEEKVRFFLGYKTYQLNTNEALFFNMVHREFCARCREYIPH
jgi:hypothetical protein